MDKFGAQGAGFAIKLVQQIFQSPTDGFVALQGVLKQVFCSTVNANNISSVVSLSFSYWISHETIHRSHKSITIKS